MTAAVAKQSLNDPFTDKQFPMPVGRFLAEAEKHLNRGDIVLSRGNTLSSRLIRRATGGFFSHAALVFLVPQPEEGFSNTFLVESVSSGVGIASLKGWIAGRRPIADIAIVRVEQPGLDEDYFRQVRGLMLDYVKSGYDYSRAFRLGLSFLFASRLGWFSMKEGGRTSMRAAIRQTRSRPVRWVPPQFICSGFIQYGYVAALARRGEEASRVVFKDGLSELDRDGLLATTPEDIARSDKVTWRFAVRRGWVHQVKDYASARRVISGAKS